MMASYSLLMPKTRIILRFVELDLKLSAVPLRLNDPVAFTYLPIPLSSNEQPYASPPPDSGKRSVDAT